MKKCIKIAIFILLSIAATVFCYVDPNIKAIKPAVKPLTVNVQLKNNDDIMFCFDDFCTSGLANQDTKIVSYKGYNKSVKKLYVTPYENIDYIVLEKGSEFYSYDKEDISKLQKRTFEIALDDGGIEKFQAVEISEINNYNGTVNHILLTLLKTAPIIIIIGLLLSFNIETKTYWTLFLIILFAIALRINGILYYPLWFDELYTKTIGIESFKSTFIDPGNPPLFYFLEYLISSVFGKSTLILRIIPLFASVLIIPFVYLIFKDYSKNLALVVSAFACLNTIFIYHAQEARGYSLCMFLSVLAIYVFTNYLKNRTTKNLVLYSFIVALLINANYYLIIFAFTNFIWGLIKLKDSKLKFILANFIAGLTLIPYLLTTLPIATNSTFNTWIPPLNKHLILYAINHFFINRYIFIVFVTIAAFAIIYSYVKKHEIKDILSYLSFSTVLVITLILLVSFFIKPIFHKRLLFSVYGIFFVLNAAIFISFAKLKFKNFYLAAYAALLLLITHPMQTREACNINSYINFIKFDSPKYEKVTAMIPDDVRFLGAYPDVEKLNIDWVVQKTNSTTASQKIETKYGTTYFSTIGNDCNESDYCYLSNITSYGKTIKETK